MAAPHSFVNGPRTFFERMNASKNTNPADTNLDLSREITQSTRVGLNPAAKPWTTVNTSFDFSQAVPLSSHDHTDASNTELDSRTKSPLKVTRHSNSVPEQAMHAKHLRPVQNGACGVTPAARLPPHMRTKQSIVKADGPEVVNNRPLLSESPSAPTIEQDKPSFLSDNAKSLDSSSAPSTQTATGLAITKLFSTKLAPPHARKHTLEKVGLASESSPSRAKEHQSDSQEDIQTVSNNHVDSFAGSPVSTRDNHGQSKISSPGKRYLSSAHSPDFSKRARQDWSDVASNDDGSFDPFVKFTVKRIDANQAHVPLSLRIKPGNGPDSGLSQTMMQSAPPKFDLYEDAPTAAGKFEDFEETSPTDTFIRNQAKCTDTTLLGSDDSARKVSPKPLAEEFAGLCSQLADLNAELSETMIVAVARIDAIQSRLQIIEDRMR